MFKTEVCIRDASRHAQAAPSSHKKKQCEISSTPALPFTVQIRSPGKHSSRQGEVRILLFVSLTRHHHDHQREHHHCLHLHPHLTNDGPEVVPASYVYCEVVGMVQCNAHIPLISCTNGLVVYHYLASCNIFNVLRVKMAHLIEIRNANTGLAITNKLATQ